MAEPIGGGRELANDRRIHIRVVVGEATRLHLQLVEGHRIATEHNRQKLVVGDHLHLGADDTTLVEKNTITLFIRMQANLPCLLEDSLIVPVRVNLLQDAGNAIVLAKLS